MYDNNFSDTFYTYLSLIQVNNYEGWHFIRNKCSELPHNPLINYGIQREKYTNYKCRARCIFRNGIYLHNTHLDQKTPDQCIWQWSITFTNSYNWGSPDYTLKWLPQDSTKLTYMFLEICIWNYIQAFELLIYKNIILNIPSSNHFSLGD